LHSTYSLGPLRSGTSQACWHGFRRFAHGLPQSHRNECRTDPVLGGSDVAHHLSDEQPYASDRMTPTIDSWKPVGTG